jgi:predicted porin
MKKTLIALAAVAVTSTAMAQVTISGVITAGFKTSTTSSTVNDKGFGFDDSSVTFAISEDLGGGLKLNASMSIDAMGEADAVTGNGNVLNLTGGFGSLTFSDVGGSDYLPIDGLTANANGTTGDRVNYTLPTMVPGLSATISYKDGSTQGFGSMNPVGSSTSVILGYQVGALTLAALSTQMTDFAPAAGLQSRVGFKIGYDLGVAAVTYGQLDSDNGTNVDNKETGLTVTAPVGPVAVAIGYATSKDVGAVSRKGNSLKVSYPMSKRTSLALYTESYDGATAADANVTETGLRLSHSF